jgi:hypothetical protein
LLGGLSSMALLVRLMGLAEADGLGFCEADGLGGGVIVLVCSDAGG